MIVQIYVDDKLMYDNRLPEESGYHLSKAEIEETLNKGGTATLGIPPGHPLHGACRAYAVPVEIYKDKRLRWRGRPLPASRDLYLQDTIVCEGEFCFLNDAIMRPYSYEDAPDVVFRDVMEQYNTAMEANPWKQFVVGNITVEGEAVELEEKSPKKVRETVEKLIEEWGGYIIFDDAPGGGRRINWLAQLPYTCNQAIALGVNLTDYSCEVDNPDFCTRLIPYGKGDGDDPLQIDVDGKDYVENPEAVALYGIIEGTKDYRDIEDAGELLEAAEADIKTMGVLPPIAEISAVDLSRQDSTLDDFRIGQVVSCHSAPHNMDGTYALLSLKEDLIDPKSGKVTLTYETAASTDLSHRTLSGAVAVSQRRSQSAVEDLARKSSEKIKNKLAQHPVNTCVTIYGAELPEDLYGGGVWERVPGAPEGISIWRRTQ